MLIIISIFDKKKYSVYIFFYYNKCFFFILFKFMSFYSIKISEIKSRKKGKKLCVKTFSKRLRENLGKKGKKKNLS